MNQSIAAAITRLSRDAASSDAPDLAGEAARATGGLPVQCDMGGALVLLPSGDVVHYDPERKTFAGVTDARWRMAAIVKASRRHAELADLLPTRP